MAFKSASARRAYFAGNVALANTGSGVIIVDEYYA